MNPIDEIALSDYIAVCVQSFHERRIASLNRIDLRGILKRKNPYLFRAKNVQTAADLARGILDAFLSSQEEGIFGGFLEQIAIFTCEMVFDGRKSSAEGIDLEFTRDGILHIVAIKSGPNWGNSSQIRKMREDFNRARRILATNSPGLHVRALNGCCYGKQNRQYGDYTKICGQKFWEFISGNPTLYTDIIEPMGHKAKEKNEFFMEEYTKLVNRFTRDFLADFCLPNGAIDWEKLVAFNSAAGPMK